MLPDSDLLLAATLVGAPVARSGRPPEPKPYFGAWLLLMRSVVLGWYLPGPGMIACVLFIEPCLVLLSKLAPILDKVCLALSS